MFQANAVKKLRAHNPLFNNIFFFRKSCPLWENV